MILDYIKWRGDLSFKVSPFNKIDALILSRVSYMDLNIASLEKVNLKVALEKFLKLKNLEKKTLWHLDIDLAKELISSKRFSELEIHNYIDKVSIKEEKQFSAVCIDINEKTTFISFRGTDMSVVGWKEDFNMSFSENIPAQKEAEKYLENIMKLNENNIILGGHSKGGNLAIYSSIFVKDEYRERIEKIYNFDGPGFNDKILNDIGYEKIYKKIESYVPKEAIVGILFNRKEKFKIVKSNKKSLMQHDVYTWLIDKNDFIYDGKLSKSSYAVINSLTSWLKEVDENQRKEFVDILFETIGSVDSDVREVITNVKGGAKLLYLTINNPVLREHILKIVSILINENFK